MKFDLHILKQQLQARDWGDEYWTDPDLILSWDERLLYDRRQVEEVFELADRSLRREPDSTERGEQKSKEEEAMEAETSPWEKFLRKIVEEIREIKCPNCGESPRGEFLLEEYAEDKEEVHCWHCLHMFLNPQFKDSAVAVETQQ